MSPKPKPAILELEATHEETLNFHRITISGDQKRIMGRIYISKELGIPREIVIHVIPEKEES